jgi:hypothetical protein
MASAPDFDLIVVGNETEACLSAVAGARAGAKVALLYDKAHRLGGLLTDGGLAFVDRDSRHEFVADGATQDGLFGRFLQRAGVRIVALDPQRGHDTLAAMLGEAGVTLVPGRPSRVRLEGSRITGLTTADGADLSARHWLDATPDGDLAELVGVTFADGFREYGVDRYLGISPLPLIDGVDGATIGAGCERLARDEDLQARRQRTFGDRRFLDLDVGPDYVLVGPPYLGLAYQRWRETQGLDFPYPFQADGFNVAMVGPEQSSWNGLIYFADQLPDLLRLSRQGADNVFRQEAELFVWFLRESMGWSQAKLAWPTGMYVRQSRHALGTKHRLRLAEIVAGYDVGSVGTFAYYADFRGFSATPIPRYLTAHVILDAGRFDAVTNLGIASRAGGYTAFAHSLCRLVQYNVTLGTGLAVVSTLGGALTDVSADAVRQVLGELDMLVDDPVGLAENAIGGPILQADALFNRETALA